MGSVSKKAVTRPLPPNAEIIVRQGVRLARWRDAKGKVRTAPLTIGKDGTERIRDESATYIARYRDGKGLVVEVSTGCRDKSAAQSVLADLERRAERVRSNMLTAAEDRMADHLTTPIADHFDAYVNSLAAAGSVPLHRHNVRTYLDRLADACGFKRLNDLNREALDAGSPRKRRTTGRLALETVTGLQLSPSPIGAPTRASDGSLPIRSRGCRRRTRRPTLAVAAGR